MWAIAILSFFVLQYGLGVSLNRPSTSREIYFGLFIIPITYTISVVPITSPNFLQALVAVEVPSLILFIASFYFFSPFISFFVGFDTKALNDEKIPTETMFGFDIQHSTDIRKKPAESEKDQKILDRIVQGMELSILIQYEDDSNGLMICRKEKLNIGIFYEFKLQSLVLTFIPFRIVNDKVEKVEDLEAILNLKAQITGMLYAWLQKKLILMFNEIPPNLKLGFEKVSEGLGPIRKPLIPYLKETVVSFPKNHPYRFALLISGFVIIINITLFILGKLVFT